jgi:hypothetical protein
MQNISRNVLREEITLDKYVSVCVWKDNIQTQKHCMGLWAGFTSLRTGSGGGLLRIQYGFSGSIKTGSTVAR